MFVSATNRFYLRSIISCWAGTPFFPVACNTLDKIYPGVISQLRQSYPDLLPLEERQLLLTNLKIDNKESADMLGKSAQRMKRTNTSWKKDQVKTCMISYENLKAWWLSICRDHNGIAFPVYYSDAETSLWIRNNSGIVSFCLLPKPHSVAMPKSGANCRAAFTRLSVPSTPSE